MNLIISCIFFLLLLRSCERVAQRWARNSKPTSRHRHRNQRRRRQLPQDPYRQRLDRAYQAPRAPFRARKAATRLRLVGSRGLEGLAAARLTLSAEPKPFWSCFLPTAVRQKSRSVTPSVTVPTPAKHWECASWLGSLFRVWFKLLDHTKSPLLTCRSDGCCSVSKRNSLNSNRLIYLFAGYWGVTKSRDLAQEDVRTHIFTWY